MRAVVVLATALLVAGCLGAMPKPPENPAGAGDLTPVSEDPDAGLVGVAGGFDLKRYPLILVDRFTVPPSLVKDEEDKKYAALFPVALQSEMVARLRATGLFDRVVNLSETQVTPGEQQALKLEGTITRLDPGSRALRYIVGFGAGAAKAQAETRLVDVQTGKVVVVTADRREAHFGVFGGDTEDHLREALSDMARDYAKFMVRLKSGTVVATTPTSSVDPSVISSEASGLVGTWRGTLLVSERRPAGPPRDNPAMLRIFEDGGGLRWTLESAVYGQGINGSGTVSVAGDEVRLVGTYTSRLATTRGQRVAIEYTARLDGETLQGAGVGADALPQKFTLKRAGR
jgi:hypothetical protein